MERFAFKIDKALKANLYQICRLCGIDNPEKVPIIEESAPKVLVLSVDGEPELWQKILECVGFTISRDDKMPQSICTLCVDKINDFYEFREMCFATNAQTRKLLGLKSETLKKHQPIDVKPDIKPDLKKGPRKRKNDEPHSKVEIKEDLDLVVSKESVASCGPSARKKLRLTTELQAAAVPPKKQQKRAQEEKKISPKDEIKDEPVEAPPVSVSQPTTTAGLQKLKQLCNICDQRFSNKAKLDRHQEVAHVPNIPRYICNACNETIQKNNDIKNHQLWHKLSKTPYKCGLCDQDCISIYGFSRHLRDHCQEVPTEFLVLDRECPQCRETFVTNFLYNTHPCAVRTKKCAGCNRHQRSANDYLRHAALCGKIYLNYSKHIPAAAVAAESCVRIKNENDVEAAAAAEALSRSMGISLDLTPVVSLTRLSTPLLMAANQCVLIPGNDSAIDDGDTNKKSSKKSNKKGGVSSKDLRRVDELLKSTIDALVSIKHEPEVHVETDAHTSDVEGDDGADAFQDDFHHDESDNNDNDGSDVVANIDKNTNVATEKTSENTVVVKQEVPDDAFEDQHCNNIDISIKKEVVDVTNVDGAPAAKVPILKLKIKKEHGTLNSSLVDEGKHSEKKKKKKKRKDIEKERNKMSDKHQNLSDSANDNADLINTTGALPLSQAESIQIKQERIDEKDAPITTQAEATVMTSIPLMQFQISCISSGVEFDGEMQNANDNEVASSAHSTSGVVTIADEHQEDVKPNRLELDRMLKITNVSSGIDMCTNQENAEEEVVEEAANEDENTEVSNETATTTKTTKRSQKSPAKKLKDKEDPTQSTFTVARKTGTGKAVKSTGGINRITCRSSYEVPQIVAVASGEDATNYADIADQQSCTELLAQITVKPEPCNRGYSDEVAGETHLVEPMDCESATAVQIQEPMDYEATAVAQVNEFTINEIDDEQSYIDGIDFSNIKIKQEKDIEICAAQFSKPIIATTASHNGVPRANKLNKKINKRKLAENSKEEIQEEDEEEIDEELAEEEEEEDDYEEEEEEEDEEEQEEEEEEEREYRELELPPALITSEDENDEHKKQNEQEITNMEQDMQKHTNAELPESDEHKNQNEQEITNMEQDMEKHTNAEPLESSVQSSSSASTFIIANVFSQAADVLAKPDEISSEISTSSAMEWNAAELENHDLCDDNNPALNEIPQNMNLQITNITAGLDEEDFHKADCENANVTMTEDLINSDNNKEQEPNDTSTMAQNIEIENNSMTVTDEYQSNAENVEQQANEPQTTSDNYKAKDHNTITTTTAQKVDNENHDMTVVDEYQSNVKQQANEPQTTSDNYEEQDHNTITTTEQNVDNENHAMTEVDEYQSNVEQQTNEPVPDENVANIMHKEEKVHDINTINEENYNFSTNEPTENSLDATTMDKQETNEINTLTVNIAEEKQMETMAQPFYDEIAHNSNQPHANETSDDHNANDDTGRHENAADMNLNSAIEEQQNILNHVVAEQALSAETETQSCTALQLHPYLEDISSSSGSTFSALTESNMPTTNSTVETSLSINTDAATTSMEMSRAAAASTAAAQPARNEETENLINETADAALRQQQELQQQININANRNNLQMNRLLLDDSNINEIAENNNNANIERELQDDNVQQQQRNNVQNCNDNFNAIQNNDSNDIT